MNFSSVIVHEGWEAQWRSLFAEIDGTLSAQAKAQLKCEIIMLTHNEALHETNFSWHPQGEDLLWRPDLQEEKISEGGMRNLRYRAAWKRKWLDQLLSWREEAIPYCGVRYAF